MQDWLAGAQRLIAVEMRDVARAVAELSASGSPILDEVCAHVLEAGGKRVRPMLLILACRALRPEASPLDPEVARIAGGLELIHVASLLHDDVIDGSPLRRGRETANIRWGSKVSIFAADFLFASVYSQLARPANTEVLRTVALAVVEMCRAEALQDAVAGDASVSEDTYVRVIEGKTAALFAAACEAGAILAGGSEHERGLFRDYGRQFGIAFQIADDLLDLLGSAEETGKARGSDLRGGHFTLPILGLRDRAGEAERGVILDALARWQELGEGDIVSIVRAAEEAGCFDRARGAIARAVDRALAALEPLPESPWREALTELARGIAVRRS